MNKTFLELEKQYQSTANELFCTLEKLARYCDSFSMKDDMFDDIEFLCNPFEYNTNESYFLHYIDGDKLHLSLEYKDSYDEICDSTSHMTYHLHWVEHAYNDTLDEIEDEVNSQILEYHHSENNRELKNAIHLAKHHNIISEEEAAEKLLKI